VILIPIFFMMVGVLCAYMFKISAHGKESLYIAVACIAGLDTLLGGIRAAYEKNFQNDVFISGFIANIVFAYSLAWFGDKIGVDLRVVVVLVMGMRIFNNLGSIRRHLIREFNDWVMKIRDARKRNVPAEAPTPAQSLLEGIE
jgi:small basic protein